MSRPYCRAEAFERVLQLTTSRDTGAAFTIDRNGRQWLVTARHLLPDDDPAPECKLWSRHVDETLCLPFLPDPGNDVDIAVAPLQVPITPELNLVPTSKGLMWSQEVFFLGFPYGGFAPQELLEFPAVKHAIISGMRRQPDGKNTWLLDGQSNPGFSGGPVVAHTESFSTMQVVAVIRGALEQRRPVVLSETQTPLSEVVVQEDTGIIVAPDIRYATELIDAI